ncbi:MAG: ABC transporter ATP-binding protein [Gemmatimonadetes bacterium]|nr:ABC transporter ATP-binding protein [Gemmatimonadota bacterium]
MPHALLTRGLARRMAPDFAVRDLSLTVPTGAVYGLLGPNGAGKTTTLRLILDLLRPDAGEVEILGVNARRYPAEARRRIGYVPERLGIPGWMTVARALRHHAVFFPSWSRPYAEELLLRMELPADRRVRHLSKGQAGKLALLLALAHRPSLLILDEPTDGLDPVARRDFTELLLEYVADTGATALISSHLVHELERVADWIGVIDRGSLVVETPLEAFRRSIKRLRVGTGTPLPGADGLPFDVLARVQRPREELWSVRGWEPAMGAVLAERGVEVRGVVDLDLEDCYVELLRGRGDPEEGR